MRKIFSLNSFFFLLFFLLEAQVSFSQKNYLEGYVIKQDKDTLFGYIDYRNWERNPEKIKFKSRINDIIVSYGPLEIMEFGVQGETYVSGIVEIETTPMSANTLIKESKFNVRSEALFLQTLIRSEKELYYHLSVENRENFYIKVGDELRLLYYKKYMKNVRGRNLIAKNNKFLGQLALYLKDCDDIESKLKNVDYDQKSLVNLFEYYHNCTGKGVAFKRKKEKFETELGVIVGLSLTMLEFRSDRYYRNLVNAEFKPSTDLSAGIFFDIILPKNQRKWSIGNELIFSNYNAVERRESGGLLIITEIGYSYLKLNNLVRYSHPLNRMSVYVSGGISNGIALRETNLVKGIIKNSNIQPSSGSALVDTRKYEQGFIIGSGIRLNKLSLEIRVERGNGMSEYQLLNSTTKRFFLLTSYRF
jgi:hypothetical protein